MDLTIRQAMPGTGWPQGSDADRLRDPYWLKIDLASQRYLWTLTGRLVVNFTSTSMAHYDYQDVHLYLYLEDRPANRKPSSTPNRPYDVCELVAEHWTASCHLTGISNDSTATNAGWSVETVDFNPSTRLGWVHAHFKVGAQDTDGHVMSVGYRLETLGHYEWAAGPPPID